MLAAQRAALSGEAGGLGLRACSSSGAGEGRLIRDSEGWSVYGAAFALLKRTRCLGAGRAGRSPVSREPSARMWRNQPVAAATGALVSRLGRVAARVAACTLGERGPDREVPPVGAHEPRVTAPLFQTVGASRRWISSSKRSITSRRTSTAVAPRASIARSAWIANLICAWIGCSAECCRSRCSGPAGRSGWGTRGSRSRGRRGCRPRPRPRGCSDAAADDIAEVRRVHDVEPGGEDDRVQLDLAAVPRDDAVRHDLPDPLGHGSTLGFMNVPRKSLLMMIRLQPIRWSGVSFARISGSGTCRFR